MCQRCSDWFDLLATARAQRDEARRERDEAVALLRESKLCLDLSIDLLDQDDNLNEWTRISNAEHSARCFLARVNVRKEKP